jgi:hypothetical protein
MMSDVHQERLRDPALRRRRNRPIGTVRTLGSMEVVSVALEIDVRRTGPDLRAVKGSGDLVVRRWSPRLKWSTLYREPLPAQGGFPFIGPRGIAVFELWRRPDGYFVREIVGVHNGPADGIRLLEEWATAQGGRLVVGPALPEWAPPAPPVRVSYELTPDVPAFRFVFEARGQLRVYPWGRGAEQAVDNLLEPWDGAIGDVFAIDADRAIAHFAIQPGGWRSAAERALLDWARRDEWHLSIARGLRPLAAPGLKTTAHPRRSACTDCGHTLGEGFASGIAFHNRGFAHTRCSVCGGRHVWFDEGGVS